MGNTMQYRTLGNTGLLVSRLCLGPMTFGAGEATTGVTWTGLPKITSVVSRS